MFDSRLEEISWNVSSQTVKLELGFDAFILNQTSASFIYIEVFALISNLSLHIITIFHFLSVSTALKDAKLVAKISCIVFFSVLWHLDIEKLYFELRLHMWKVNEEELHNTTEHQANCNLKLVLILYDKRQTARKIMGFRWNWLWKFIQNCIEARTNKCCAFRNLPCDLWDQSSFSGKFWRYIIFLPFQRSNRKLTCKNLRLKIFHNIFCEIPTKTWPE